MKQVTFFILCSCSFLVSQDQSRPDLHEMQRDVYNKYFDQVADEFNIPTEILRGISFTQTRWTNMKWEVDDTVSQCSGMPRVYGVMGLWNNSYFGFQVKAAATLLKKSETEIKENPLENIRAAAALLSNIFNQLDISGTLDRSELENWYHAMATFNGIPHKDLAMQLSYKAFQFLSEGYSLYGIKLPKRNVRLEKLLPELLELRNQAELKQQFSPEDTKSTPDYPLAIWRAGKADYYYTTGNPKQFVVIHDMEATYEGVVSYFQTLTDGRSVSIHYCVNGKPDVSSSPYSNAPAGEITQMVEEKNWAWHAVCWNRYMFGIEHEGYVNNPAWFTPEMYQASSRLVAYLCEKYNIPKDRYHIIGHDEKRTTAWVNWVTSTGQGFDPQCNTHTDPGQYWNWTQFMNMITIADTIKPQIQSISHSNAKPVPTYKEITATFNTSMDLTSTNNAFTITPNVAGTKSWNADNTVLTFKSTANLAFNSSYTIKIDTTAKNIGLKKTLGPAPFTVTFTTVPIDTVGPKIVQSYPYNNALNVPTKPEIWLKMSDPVLTSSLSTTLKFVDAGNSSVSMSGAKNEVIDDLGVISFFPTLKTNQTYIVKLFPGMKDFYNNLSKDTVSIQFRTEPAQFTTAGLILDQFESNGRGWLQPNQSVNSVNYDTSLTQFIFSNDKKMNGATSGKLSYKFTGSSNGVIDIPVTAMPIIDSYSSLGMWVYGDLSFNKLKYKFSPNNQIITIGNIHWRGWKFISLPIASISGTSKKLISVMVVQDSTVSAEGALSFDDMQLDAVVSGVHVAVGIHPKEFTLGQNYPNPFNPATVIPFSISKQTFVTLKIFDILGREVSLLINENKSSGEYAVAFDAERLPSGVYYYSIKAGEFTQTRKMILLK